MPEAKAPSARRVITSMLVGLACWGVALAIAEPLGWRRPPADPVYDLGVLALFVFFTVLVARFWKASGASPLGALMISVVLGGVTLFVQVRGVIALLAPLASLAAFQFVPGRTTTEDTTCPSCAETVKKAAVVCRHCGRDLHPSTPSASPSVSI
jgi:hypothetical protein